MKNLFITLEGIDGSGKTTIGHNLTAELQRKGDNVLYVHDPYSQGSGAQLRNLILNGDFGEPAEFLMFLASRAELTQKLIKPYLESGSVICDRYYDSTYVYQGNYRKMLDWMPKELFEQANKLATLGLVPDVTFLLDIDGETAASRVDNTDKFEKDLAGKYEELRALYLKRWRNNKNRIIKIDGTKPPEAIKEEIMNVLKQKDLPFFVGV